jgi:hypothetical protein
MYGIASNGESSKCSFDGHAMQAQPVQKDIGTCAKIKATAPQSGVNGGRVSSSSSSSASKSLFTQMNFLMVFTAMTTAPLLRSTVQFFM